MKKFTAVTIASVAAIALFLTGCSQVGAAATIGSTKITQATVQTSIDTVMAERTGVDTSQMQLETGEELNRSQLRFHLFAGLLKAAATSVKVTVTKAEIDTRREVIIQQVGGVTNLPQEEFYYIVPDKCTECTGFHEEPQCAAVCPVDCCVPDPDRVEDKETLMAKKSWLHAE